MSEERVRTIGRQFAENGLKLTLTNAANVRELLTLVQARMLPRLDFRGLQVDPTTYVTSEYRHVSSDLVLTLPLRSAGKRKKRLTLSILIELQMQPDRLMPLRVLEYLVQIWKHQVRRHEQKHGSLASVKLQPILPVVLHTGSYSWEQFGTLLDLMDDAEEFREATPVYQPLFFSLPDRSEAELEEKAGFLGQILALMKARTASRSAFAQRLERTVSKVEELTAETQRRLELLDYVEALVYYARVPSEHAALHQRIDAALQHNEDRLEVQMARRMMPDIHREEGALADRKRTLLEQLPAAFRGVASGCQAGNPGNSGRRATRRVAAARDHRQGSRCHRHRCSALSVPWLPETAAQEGSTEGARTSTSARLRLRSLGPADTCGSARQGV